MKRNRIIPGRDTQPFQCRAIARAVAAALLTLSLAAGNAHALPVGEQVTAGAANVARSGASLTVTQSTPNAAINWQAFGIAAGEAVRFNQPGASSVVLNRVVGQDPSQIFGALTSNGQVFLLNPNGVLFGPGAQVSVGGLVASTLNMSNADFMAGRHVLTRGAIAGSVVNQAAIMVANGGSVAFVAPQVSNTGSINAPGGTVAMGAGDKVTLTLANGSLLGFSVDQGTLDALVENKGAIRADGGVVILTARAMDGIYRSLVNNTGVIQAGTIADRNGAIWLEASDVRNAGVLEATGGTGRGGRVSLTGETVTLEAGSAIDASGAAGGGLIEVGGGWQGGGSLRHATTVTMDSGATLRANATGATGQGDGGTIAVWSDGATRVSGTLEAMGAGTGNGGRIETSGHVLDVTGISVNASAPLGAAGTWLLDPYNLTVSAAATTASEVPAGTWTSNAGGSVVLNTNINTALNAGTSVVLQTSGAPGDGFGNGDITVSAAIAKTAGADAGLTLKAAGSIIVNAAIGSTAGAMAVTLNSNTLGGGGYVNVGQPITTNGGALVIGGGATPLTGAAVGTAAQANGVLINFSGVLSAGGGDITINGIGRNTSSGSNFGIRQLAAIGTTGIGNITLNGTGGGTGLFETGVVINTDITAGTGNISITGASSSTGTILSNHGVDISGGTISTGGAGTINIDGTAAAATGVQSYGVVVQSVSRVSTIRAADGLISITGRNTATGSGIGNNGVYVKSPSSTVQSTGSGGIAVLGFGGGSGSAGADYGVYWDTANAFQSSGSGAITITGTGGDAGGSGNGNYGVYANGALTALGGAITINGTGGGAGGSGGLNTGVNITAAIAAAGGPISITGTGGATTGTGNSGVTHTAAITNTGTGSITLNGTGGGSGIQETGVLSNASIVADGGDISVTGTASASATRSTNHGVQFRAGTRSTTGAGTITIAGTAQGTGTGANAYGVSVVGGAVISAANGLVSITGINNSTGTGGGNNGVFVTDTGSTIRSTGSGSISITGTPGSSSSGTNYGIFLNAVTAAGGTLTLDSPGTVTSAGALTAASLRLLGAGGSHVLTNGGNGTGILAADTGSVNYAQASDLVIGTVGGTAGVTATGSVLVKSTGNLTLASGAGVVAGAGGDALVLVSGVDFINNAGAGALSAPNGRWLVYSTSPAGSTENGLTGAAGSTLPRLYNRTFAANPPASIAQPGNHLVYAAQPLLLTSAVDAVRSYGSASPSFTTTQGGFMVDDGIADNASTAGLSGGADLTTDATIASNVGTYVITTAPGNLASGAGYGLGFANGTLTIVPRAVTVTADNQNTIFGYPDLAFTYLASEFGSGAQLSGFIGRICLPGDRFCEERHVGRSALRVLGYGIRLPEGLPADSRRSLR